MTDGVKTENGSGCNGFRYFTVEYTSSQIHECTTLIRTVYVYHAGSI